MTLALEVYDVFGHIVPGSLYLACILYILDRLQWVPTGTLLATDAALLIVGGALVSYILGHATYDVSHLVAHPVRWRGSRVDSYHHARAEFIRRFPPAERMSIVDTNPYLLASLIEAHKAGLRAKIDKLRATAIMLRGCASALAFGSLIALVETVFSASIAAALSAVFMAAISVLLARRSRTVAIWSISKTLESALAIPEVEESLNQR